MMPQQSPRKVARGRPIEWTDDDLERLAEIHVADDTPLMLAFVEKYGSPRLLALLTAAPETAPDDGAADA